VGCPANSEHCEILPVKAEIHPWYFAFCGFFPNSYTEAQGVTTYER